MDKTPRGKAKILVVEDEQSVKDAIAKILQNNGHEVVAAADGHEALKYFEAQGDFDIVFTDLSLPGISGWDLARTIRRNSDVPIVLLSGWDISGDDENMRKSGVTRLLPKPVKVKEMLAAIKELVTKDREG